MNDAQTIQNPGNIPVVYSLPQCAKAYNLPPYALRRWIKEGKLKAIHSGRKIFINADTLNTFLSGSGAAESVNNGIRIIK